MKLLPLRPRPKSSESFASWVQRVASANGMALDDFVRTVRRKYAEAYPKRRFLTSRSVYQRITPDSIEHESCIVQMAVATGVEEEILRTLVWKSETHYYLRKFLSPVGKKRSSKKNPPSGEDATWHPESYCPECLKDDFYLRRLWRPAFPCVCFIHKRVLIDECPVCRAVLGFYDERRSSHDGGSRSTLLCRCCGFDLTSIQRQTPAPQHLNLVRLLTRCYAEPPASRFDGDALILHAFHWWMEAFFQTCTTLPLPPMIHRNSKMAQMRAAYTYQSCRVRCALFESACKAINRAGQENLPWEPEDSVCMDWLGARKWSDFCNVSARLVTMFPELAQQSNIRAPDRAILPW